jgi:hypothetical protein
LPPGKALAQDASGFVTQSEREQKGGGRQHDLEDTGGYRPGPGPGRPGLGAFRRSVTKALIGAGILGLLATLWSEGSEWSKWRRYKVVYVEWHNNDGVRSRNRRASAEPAQRAAATSFAVDKSGSVTARSRAAAGPLWVRRGIDGPSRGTRR